MKWNLIISVTENSVIIYWHPYHNHLDIWSFEIWITIHFYRKELHAFCPTSHCVSQKNGNKTGPEQHENQLFIICIFICTFLFLLHMITYISVTVVWCLSVQLLCGRPCGCLNTKVFSSVKFLLQRCIHPSETLHVPAATMWADYWSPDSLNVIWIVLVNWRAERDMIMWMFSSQKPKCLIPWTYQRPGNQCASAVKAVYRLVGFCAQPQPPPRLFDFTFHSQRRSIMMFEHVDGLLITAAASSPKEPEFDSNLFKPPRVSAEVRGAL